MVVCKQHCISEKRTKYITPETNISTSFAKLHLLMPTNICSGAPMTAGHSSLQTTIFTMKLILPLFWPFDTQKCKVCELRKKTFGTIKAFFAPKSIPCTDEEETYVQVEFSSCLLKMFYLYSYPEILLRVENILKSIFYA